RLVIRASIRMHRILPSHLFAGQLAGLFYPCRELGFVEGVVFMDVEVARIAAFGFDGRNRVQLPTAEERDLDVLREAMERDEPAVALDAIERRIPFDRLVYAGDRARDERVEASAHVPLPPGHRR